MSIDQRATLVFTQDDILLNEFFFLLFIFWLRPETISWRLADILTTLSSGSETICPLVKAFTLAIAPINIVVASLEIVTGSKFVEWHIPVPWC